MESDNRGTPLSDAERPPPPPVLPSGTPMKPPPSPMEWDSAGGSVSEIHIKRVGYGHAIGLGLIVTLAACVIGFILAWAVGMAMVIAYGSTVGLDPLDVLEDLIEPGLWISGSVLAAVPVAVVAFNLLAALGGGWTIRLPEPVPWYSGDRRLTRVNPLSAAKIAAVLGGALAAVVGVWGMVFVGGMFYYMSSMASGGSGPPAWSAVVAQFAPAAWFLAMPPIVALLASLSLNACAKWVSPLPLRTVGGLAPRERLVGDVINRDRVRVRGVGLLIPGLVAMVLALGTYIVVLVLAIFDGAMSYGVDWDDVLTGGVILVVLLAISFVGGVVAALVFNGACRVFGGIDVEVA